MVVLTTDSSLGGRQSVPWVVRPCSCSSLISSHIGAPEEGLWCSSFSLLLHAFVSLAANRCCLESRITGAGVSPDSLISAPCGVVGSAPRMDLACRLRRSWRSSRLPTSLGSHQSSLPYSATARTHATWTALTLSGTTPYVLVRVLIFQLSDTFRSRGYTSFTPIVKNDTIDTRCSDFTINHLLCLLRKLPESNCTWQVRV
jgi:hypothetical protein